MNFAQLLAMFQPALVLRSFEIDENGTAGHFLRIVGRKGGLISWILALFKLERSTTITLGHNSVVYHSHGMSGDDYITFPLTSIASTSCGFSRPIHFLFLGVGFMIGGVVMSMAARGDQATMLLLVGLGVGVVLFVLYFLQKKLSIGIESAGTKQALIVFKRSVIENVKVDYDMTKQAIDLINRHIVHAQKG